LGTPLLMVWPSKQVTLADRTVGATFTIPFETER
jgi:hypothetical protein